MALLFSFPSISFHFLLTSGFSQKKVSLNVVPLLSERTKAAECLLNGRRKEAQESANTQSRLIIIKCISTEITAIRVLSIKSVSFYFCRWFTSFSSLSVSAIFSPFSFFDSIWFVDNDWNFLFRMGKKNERKFLLNLFAIFK